MNGRIALAMLAFGLGAAGAGVAQNMDPQPSQARPQAQAPAEVGAPRVPSNGTGVAPVKVQAGDDGTTKGEAPLDTSSEQPANDVAAASSPVTPERRGLYLRPGLPLQVKLGGAISSAGEKNGQTVDGVLLVPVQASDGRTMAAGTPVRVTVVSAAAAGSYQSAGLLTVQVDRVGGVAVITNVLDFDGQEGHKDVADSAPDKGTEATIGTDAVLQFRVMGAGNQPDDSKGPARQGGGGGQQGGGQRGGRSVENGAAAPGTSQQPGMQTAQPGATTPH